MKAASSGEIMATAVNWHEHIPDPFAAEAIAGLEAGRVAAELGFRNVMLEGDSLTVVKKIACQVADRSVVSAYIWDAKQIAREESSTFACKRRFTYWVEEAPSEVEETAQCSSIGIDLGIYTHSAICSE
ncbi:hypothetical protein Golob_018736, partial [Gossypium lobatum]|nr:hypothetical protein [Gossypium lobatum]